MHSILPLLLCWSSLAATSNADSLTFYVAGDCPSNMNTGGGAFQANLGVLLSSFPAAAAPTRFATSTSGTSPDQAAYGLAQCRADLNASECRSCLDLSAREIASKCPGHKSAMVIYEGCLFRLSDTSFFRVPDLSAAFHNCSPNGATQPDFNSSLGKLMTGSLAEKAYGTPRMFAVGTIDLTPYDKIYGMAQCTRDLSGDDCHNCLVKAVSLIPELCPGVSGGRIFYRSCSIRFEVDPFYNLLAAEAAMSSPAPAPAPPNGSDAVSGSTAGGGSSYKVRNTALLVTIPVASTLLLLLVAVYICKNRKSCKHVQIASDGYEDDEEMKSSGPLQYDLSTLRAATGNFSQENKLGQGGFGPVYKGTLENGQEIAVKRLLSTSHQGQVEMKNEVVLVAKLQHKNLVRLLGFCVEEGEKLLVYEFLSNKSLDKIIFGPGRQQELSWGQRYKIIQGIGRALMYLHEDSRLKVIHRDLKPGNILLDVDMNPKISDFGLARLFSIDASVAGTNHLAGTLGYMAPEYVMQGIFSTKSDVYSYGVLVLEIITGRPVHQDLINFVWRHWTNGSIAQQLLDDLPLPVPADELGRQEMLRCIHVGLLCIQDDPQHRPGMASVVLMLSSRSATALSAPNEPAFAIPGGRLRPAAPAASINEASVSDLEPR